MLRKHVPARYLFAILGVGVLSGCTRAPKPVATAPAVKPSCPIGTSYLTTIPRKVLPDGTVLPAHPMHGGGADTYVEVPSGTMVCKKV
jgi:hypothetical protein